jgi:hypothetical protein
VRGSRGRQQTLVGRPAPGSLTFHDGRKPYVVPRTDGGPRGRHGVLQELRRAVRDGAHSPLAAASNLRSLGVVIGSIVTGQTVRIPELLASRA